MDCEDYQGSSWYDLSRDRLENLQSLGHTLNYNPWSAYGNQWNQKIIPNKLKLDSQQTKLSVIQA